MKDLKVGDKVELLGDYCGFKKGQVVELCTLCADGVHLFKVTNDACSIYDGIQGSYLYNHHYKVVTQTAENKPHHCADLMLKYAMIAQYDDNPWDSFEFKNQYTHSWMGVVDHPCWDTENEYRLKQQDPKIQIGQIWVDDNGLEVTVTNSPVDIVSISLAMCDSYIYWMFPIEKFLQNFKRKE